ncbi:FAD-dependent oxidoreductase [Eggerthellaceae bacterium zg-997]|nr:FAD-dependent oxidoreductase [Eggerthellaceae bacterium zg-997]
MNTIAIIGGGAAGLTAAIAAAEAGARARIACRVIVYERDDRVGRSILATGNGRCNVSNALLATDPVETARYYNAPFVRAALAQLARLQRDDGGVPASAQARGKSAAAAGAPAWTAFDLRGACDSDAGGSAEPKSLALDADPVLAFLADRGLQLRQEGQGRLYPAANKAASVLEVLRAAAARSGVIERLNWPVSSIEAPRREGGPFTLRSGSGEFARADAVVVAVGGKGVAQLGLDHLGMRVLRTRPVLGPLRTDVGLTRELDNIRVRCVASLHRAGAPDAPAVVELPGEVLFRSYGLSGIAAFDLSRAAWPGDTVALNLLPCPADQAEDFLRARCQRLAEVSLGTRITCEDAVRGLVLPRVAEAVAKRAGVRLHDRCQGPTLSALARALSRVTFEVQGMGDANQCQVHRGGIDVDAVDPLTLRAQAVPGLFVAGEALDVDGPCGGYNLHWAWGSGLLAGIGAAAHCGAAARGGFAARPKAAAHREAPASVGDEGSSQGSAS